MLLLLLHHYIGGVGVSSPAESAAWKTSPPFSAPKSRSRNCRLILRRPGLPLALVVHGRLARGAGNCPRELRPERTGAAGGSVMTHANSLREFAAAARAARLFRPNSHKSDSLLTAAAERRIVRRDYLGVVQQRPARGDADSDRRMAARLKEFQRRPFHVRRRRLTDGRTDGRAAARGGS